MKLNINAKELLALYNVLYERFDGTNTAFDESPGDSDHVQLKQVYTRLRAILIAGVTNPGKQLDPIDSWLGHEQRKIDGLTQQNEQLKAAAANPDQFIALKDILNDDDDEIPGDLPYPKKKGPGGMPPPGKYRGKKR